MTVYRVLFPRTFCARYTIATFKAVASSVRSRPIGPRAAGAACVTHTERNELDQWTRTTHVRATLVMERERWP